jgi:hypothetical protein
MANLIDTTYFINELVIPQMGYASNNTVDAVVNGLINKYEPDILTKVMGVGFKSLYDAGITNNTQRFKDIRDGVIYTDASGQSFTWVGLTGGANKDQSIIAMYVYYWYMRNKATTSTGSGEGVIKVDTMQSVSIMDKANRAWNEMCRLIQGNYNTIDSEEVGYLWHMLCYRWSNNALVYPEFDLYKVKVTRFNPINSFGI